MAGSSTLTFKILGKDVSASKALKGVGQQAGKTGGKLSGAFSALGGPAGIATAAAAGITAVGFALFDAGKAAAEDEAEQRKLAKTLKNVTGATDDQVASVEEYIDATQRATGVADSELRPAFEKLVRATEDSGKAQEILNTALDVAAGTGKPVEAIASALAKAYNGQTGALGRLGVNMKDANGKALPFEEAMKKLNKQFGGQAATQADTYQGKMDQVGVAFDELKESIGTKVLPILETFADWLAEDGLPKLETLWATIDKKVIPIIGEYLTPVIDGVRGAFSDMGKTVEDNKDFFNDLMTVAKPLAAFAGGQMAGSLKVLAWLFERVTDAAVFSRNAFLKVQGAAKNVTDFIGGAVSAMAGLIRNAIRGLRSLWNSTIGGKGFTVPDWVKYLPGGGDFAGKSFTVPYLASGALVTGPTLALVGEGPEPEAVLPLSRLDSMLGGRGSGVTVNVYADTIVGQNAGRDLVAIIESALASGTARPRRLVTR